MPPLRPLRIAVIGAPCTGKTTLARALGRALGAPVAPEAARLHAERVRRALDEADAEAIARLALELEQQALAAAPPVVVLDTDLLSTVVYARHYYGRCAPWIARAARRRRPGLYLLCRADLPFEAEPIQRGDGSDQAVLSARFESAVLAAGAPVAFVEGAGPGREATALAAAQAYLADPGAFAAAASILRDPAVERHGARVRP